MCWVRSKATFLGRHSQMLFGITMGDASGVGPEILLHAFANGEIEPAVVAFGDIEPLEYYNNTLGYRVPLRKIDRPSSWEPGALNIVDLGAMSRNDVTPGQLSAKSGQA